ncbi:ATP-dependent RNA helicase DEAH12, chloroplastic-like isoform X2 [Orbicella faveolata]|uniref:ATP-dependent RNA helicase DEAH12, chloroplastic-like isoform X2 n=1 Tax=Orbicella faveolata TaxID=48498 RepID=UPI0009E51A5B|nr:ATP-dependent RNA helicase DEAH12, chloroplastic-like isoform X2 [Orbicella faveolata]
MDSFADATGNGQQVDGSNGTLQDLSPQTGNVHDEEEAMIAHASDLVTHHDPLGASANKHGSEHSRRRRRRSKSHSSGDCSPIGNPTRNDAAANGQQVDSPNGTLRDPSPQTGNVHDEEEAIIAHASDLVTHHDPLGASTGKHGSEHSRRHRRHSKSHSSGRGSPAGNPTRNGDDQKQRRTSCKATINPSTKDAAGNGQQVDSPNGTLQDPSPQTGNVHDEEEAIIPHASDKFTHHDPLGASADKHGSEHSRRHRRRSKSHSSGCCPPDGNPNRNGDDQKHRKTSCKAMINPSTKDALGNGQQVDGSNGISQNRVLQAGNVCGKEEAIVPHASDKFTHHDPLGACSEKHGSERSRRHRRRSKSHSSGRCTPIGYPTQNVKDQEPRRTSRKATANTSRKGNTRRLDGSNGLSQDPSSQTENVHDEKAIDPSDTLKHPDPLGVPGNKQGGENARKHRRSNTRSSGGCGPVSNPTGKSKDPERKKTSGKVLAITAETLLANCQKELQEKMTAVTEQHSKKIDGISGLLGRLRVLKPIRLEDYERICSEREALKQKKDELQLQKDEFQRFKTQITSCLLDQSSQPLSRVKGTIKELRIAVGRECHRLEAALPMYARKTTITDTVKQNQVCVVLGETGSGKSTQMTQYLYEAGFAKNGLIVCTQPRKVAATSLAAHVAEEMGGVVGQVVGCHVGGNIQASKKTGIIYATDHILLNECLRDPNLSKYSCIIIDEAHERSLYSDLLLGMIKKSLARRPELRVVITSATIDPALFVTYFDECPVLKVSGRMFPVNVIWKDGPTSNAENYLQEAVNAVQEIHRKEGPGDILVFLVSPVETERACEKLGKMEPDPNLVCLPLHGKLRQEEQRRVFKESAGKRKVIFATNCAETSITIPGIRYVVDTGMVKEMTFDPKRNKSSLEVTTIHKSSAEQRKGRAGRTQAGKCYRLYSEEEYAAMEDRSRPEILRVHLGQAVLKLMELGIENMTEFEFVESPPLDSIKLALEDLELLGATANGQLTELGHKIARVPLEPRLAKLLFDGIDQGVGADALALAAIATVSGSVFFRMGSEEEKHLADSRKVGFCHNGGDLLTLLEVHRQYLKQPKGKRNKWTRDNSLNAKSLRLADETIKELKLALKHELNIRVPDASQQNDTDLKLQKILISCYCANICVFTGHQKAGYKVVAFNHCAQLHPSSALKFLGETPQFIVFEQLLKTSRDFVINATPVEEKWLQEIILRGAVKYNMEELMSTVLTEVALPCSRDLMTLAFGGFRRRMIDKLEEKVSKCCDGGLVVLEKNEESGQVKIFVPPIHVVKALSVVGRHLEENRKLLRDEQKEEYLREDCQSSRIVWGQGGEVQELLMPHMYRTVTVGEIQDGNALVVLDFVKSFGDIVKHSFKEQNGKMRLFATFKYSEDAAMAVKGSSSSPLGIDEKVQPSQSMSDDVHAQVPHFKVKAKWLRRPAKGTGSIEFFNADDFEFTLSNLSFQSLMIKSKRVTFQADKLREEQLFMRGLHPETSMEDVKSAIERRLPSVKLKDVFIHRVAEFHTSDETLAQQKLSFQERLENFATEGHFSVHLSKPSPKHFDGHAYLTFQDAEEAQAVVRGLNGERIFDIGIVTLEPILSTFLLCSKNIFTIIEDELRAVANELDINFDKRLVMKVNNQRKDQRVSIEIQSDCTEHFIRATTVFNEILNGDRIDCKTSKTLEILMTNQVKEVLRAIEKDTGTVINQDWKNRVVRIHGSEASRESAKRAINKYLDDSIASNSHPWEIQLRGPGKPRGLLKALFKRFGVDLKGLQDIPGVQKIHVEFRNHVLKIQSSDEARETINRYVEECSENLPKKSSLLPSEGQTQLTCGICLCDVGDTADLYRLACCGHSYDKSCVIQQLISAEFPLKCATEDCEELFVWRDLQNLLSEKERKKLAVSALDEYVKRNPEIVKYCPTADCGMVYRVSTEGRRFTCCACLAEICTSCQVQWHNGLTCAMLKSGKQVEGRLEDWMMKDPSNRKNCPKCKTPIEKNEGCNHMTCSGCKSHMCWLCLEVFPTGEQVYAHQKHCPKR